MTISIAATSAAGLVAAGAEPTAAFAERLRRAWSDYRLYRATLAELRGLSNRDLSDIGLGAGDLNRSARSAVYGS
jgi:uncharacterized protein YjiS (DUF1127 family)